MHIEKVEFLKSVFNTSSVPEKALPSVAFAGRSNVGKSSVINRLLRRKGIAKISSKPGKTICINYYIVNNKYYFVDLPGYGYSKVPKKMQKNWKYLIESFIKSNEQLKCVVIIIDIRIGVDAKNIEAIRKDLADTVPLIPFSSLNDRWTSTLYGEIDKYLLIS